MAEVFGVAAGAIGVVSLSIQLAESLHKVKSFYQSVKNAPPQVADLIEEIEIMQDILGDLETGSQGASVASTPTMRRCMKVADGATKRFTTFATELQTRIKKSKYRGGIKFALSRDDIKQMLDQLERTKSSLGLAYSLYQQATAEDRHAALIQAVSSSQGTAVQTTQAVKVLLPTKDITGLTHGGRQLSRRQLATGKMLFKLTTPDWLSSTICQLEVRRPIMGLKVFMRIYGIVPYEAPVFEACRRGDVVGMQRLFDSGLASPFDRNNYGESLWESAVVRSNVEALRFLSRYDAASAEDDNFFNLVVFHNNSQVATHSTVTTVGCSLREDMLWLSDFYSEIPDGAFGYSHLRSDYSRAIRLLSCSQDCANSISFWQCFEQPYGIERYGILSKRYCQDMLSQYVPEHHDGRTPLQLLVADLAFCLARELSKIFQNLEAMIVCIIESGADLHEAVHGYTPLAIFLRTILSNWRYRRDRSGEADLRPKDLRRMLKVWLNILQCAGVDLIIYGAEEKRILEAHCFIENPPIPAAPCDWGSFVFGDEVSNFTFSYGPLPDDWTVQFDMVEEYASDFRRMIELSDETELRAVPGGWIDT